MHWIESFEPGGDVRCSACGHRAPFDRESGEYVKPRVCIACGESTDLPRQGRLLAEAPSAHPRRKR